MERVLVTGAGGFIGSHLTERLMEGGYSVRALVHYNAMGSNGWLDRLPENGRPEILRGDVRDYHCVRNAMNGCQAVFHLAALISIPYSYESPESYVDTNIRGTLNILNAARDLGVERVLITSTSEVYGTAQYVPMDEKHPYQGQSPYSATKIGADRLAESYYRSFGVPVTIVRPFNTYGPRQSPRAVIPAIILQLLSGVRILKLGALTPTRDFNYVKDTAEGFFQIYQSSRTIGEEINIATGREVAIGELARALISAINPGTRIEEEAVRIRPEKSEVRRLLGCSEKLRELTTWRSAWSLEQGLEETVRFYRDNFEKYTAAGYQF